VKVLTLVRHAKSSWKDVRLSDVDRPLKKRGRRDALAMGQRLAEREACPDAVLTSPAKRALMTAKLMAERLGFPLADIQVSRKIYGADDDDLLEIIRGLCDNFDRVMLVGHNPELTALASRLVPLKLEKLPTCGVVQISYAIDHWTQVGSTEATRSYLDYPKKPKPE